MSKQRKPSATEQAAAGIRALARRAGLTVSAALTHDYNSRTGEWDGKVLDATVTAETTFTPGDARAYRVALAACTAVLAEFPMIRPGTTWGTDSASVGGAAGLSGGYARLSKSGVPIRLARQFAPRAGI